MMHITRPDLKLFGLSRKKKKDISSLKSNTTINGEKEWATFIFLYAVPNGNFRVTNQVSSNSLEF